MKLGTALGTTIGRELGTMVGSPPKPKVLVVPSLVVTATLPPPTVQPGA